MSESSTIQLPSACPEWCVGDHQDGDVDVIDGSAYHPGPTFGRISLSGITSADGHVTDLVADVAESGQRGSLRSPKELHDLAADVMAAAEWLETRA